MQGCGELSGYGVGLQTRGPGLDSRCHKKIHQVHAVYVLIKSTVLTVPWSVFGSLPKMLDQEKIFLSFKNKIVKTEAEVQLWLMYMGLVSQEISNFALNSIKLRYGAWSPKRHKQTIIFFLPEDLQLSNTTKLNDCAGFQKLYSFLKLPESFAFNIWYTNILKKQKYVNVKPCNFV